MTQEKACDTLKRHAQALNERMHARKRGKVSDISHRGYGRALRKFVFLAQEVVPESALLRSPAFSKARGKIHGLAYHDAVEFLADLESIATDLAAALEAKDHFVIRDAVLACKAQLHSVHVNMHVDGGPDFLLYNREVGLSMPAEERVPGEVEEPAILGMAKRRADALLLQQWMSVKESLAAERPAAPEEGAPAPLSLRDVVDRGRATHRQLEQVKAFACGALSNFQLVPVVVQDAAETAADASADGDADARKRSATGKTIRSDRPEHDGAVEGGTQEAGAPAAAAARVPGDAEGSAADDRGRTGDGGLNAEDLPPERRGGEEGAGPRPDS